MKPVLGHVLRNVPNYVLMPAPQHVLRHMPDKHMLEHMSKQLEN